MKMADAKQKRNEQLKRWIGSETDLEPPVVKRQKTKVKFDDGAVFLAACSSGDTDEVLKLLHRGADINYANVDGLTALHQACIDDNVDMVKFLVENGANINQPDNEGWIPLHAAASCGYLDIAEFLIGQGAHVGAVNSEGDTPLDIAEEEAMEELLQNEVNRQGVDIEAARKEEERIMLRDARQWLNSGHINDVRHAKSGGTALHVAAAKGYTEVLKLLIQAGYDVNIKDYDGWTPLHAAAHWGKEEACRILVDSLCDMEMVNKVGQTAFDVADEDILGYLEELQKKQNLLHSEKREKKSPLIESTANMDNNQSQKTFKNKETLIIEPEKNASRIESLEQEKVDDEEEGKKDESSCSSEEDEEDDSESEAETDKTKSMASVTNANTSSTQAAPVAVTTPTVSSGQATPTSPIKKYDFIAPIMPVVESVDPASWRQGLRKTGIVLVPSKGEKSMFPTSATKISPKEEERKDESPASWRLGLRKTGSYGALAEITASKEAQKEKDTAGVMRSASSPRLSSSLDNKEKEKDSKGTRLAYVAPTIPRRLASTSDIEEKENRDSSSLRTSSSYTRRKWEDDLKKNSSINEGSTYHKSCSFGRRQDDLISSSVPSTTSTPTVTSAAGLQKSLLSSTSTTTKITTGSSSAGTQSSTSNRLWAEDSTEKEKDSVPTAVTIPVAPTVVNAAASTTTLTTTTAGTVSSTSEVRERRRSYLTPVRDEESESQRKARSRQARQSRRSTQGVTLTDLQEAEKTIGRSRSTRTREQENEEKEKEEKEKQDKEKQEEKKESETSREDEYKQKYSRTYDETYQRYRPVSTSSSTTPSSSLSTMSSSLYASSQLNRPNSLVGITSAYSRGLTKENEREGEKREEEKEGEDKSQPKSIRERRRPREKRRSTGVSFWTQDSDENEQEQQSDTEEGSNKKETQTDSISRYEISSTSASDRYDSLLGRSGSYSYSEERKPYSSRLEKDDSTDFKKLYEQILAENEKLKAQLHDTNMELTDLKLQLEKATQRQERFADRSLLEMEKRERRALERRISEMEEELKMLPDLKADNQRLKDENGALIRVISKLSK
ncbi:protein phosphatase 1 regulatory subunit 12A isoform X2 [Balaenoptera ricei]|uniref:Protein phosphatase 1 regulatory subunit n=2 Tax=Cetacea TaxID=9721 RepID=A0A455BB58_PHYMC|nr:protein phosphatase 1 regulatory subunit 12A isoform X3 [Physeter catodon]XP_036721457.1 protein phosphatase 1 regulatory subunit 12A isoform X2 [Balaenoptera musculus]XP_059792556.1 protein phosphatase 1 regulatory subunit 12A isoform X2 [Balaenoptera ricei]|eukprot:XP_028346210.1 protein phosphatase 1 regulatory subunit 12A isoform X3 [Physeter catodon]